MEDTSAVSCGLALDFEECTMPSQNILMDEDIESGRKGEEDSQKRVPTNNMFPTPVTACATLLSQVHFSGRKESCFSDVLDLSIKRGAKRADSRSLECQQENISAVVSEGCITEEPKKQCVSTSPMFKMPAMHIRPLEGEESSFSEDLDPMIEKRTKIMNLCDEDHWEEQTALILAKGGVPEAAQLTGVATTLRISGCCNKSGYVAGNCFVKRKDKRSFKVSLNDKLSTACRGLKRKHVEIKSRIKGEGQRGSHSLHKNTIQRWVKSMADDSCINGKEGLRQGPGNFRQGYTLCYKNNRVAYECDEMGANVNAANNMAVLDPVTMLKKGSLEEYGVRKDVRCIAKAALVEAGFRIEFRPRKSGKQQDSVYVSPQGMTYWSVPNAWRAMKEMEAAREGCQERKATTRRILKRQKALDTSQETNGEALENLKMVVHPYEKGCLQLTKSELTDHSREDSGLVVSPTKSGDNCLSKTMKRMKFDKHPMDMEYKHKKPLMLTISDSKVRQSHKTSTPSFPVLPKGKIRRCKTDGFELDKSSARNLKDKHLFSRSPFELDGINKKVELSIRGAKSMGEGGVANLRRNYERKDRAFSNGIIESIPSQKDNRFYAFDRLPKSVRSRDHCRGKNKVFDPAKRKRKSASLDVHFSLPCANKRGKLSVYKQLSVLGEKAKKPRHRPGCKLEVWPSNSRKDVGSEVLSLTNKQTILSWLIDRDILSEGEKVHYVNEKDNQIVKKGVITREGVLCKCCKVTFTLSNFEVHSGSECQKTGSNIFFKGGKSLFDCMMKAWDLELELMKLENNIGVTKDDSNDDTCGLCGDGGDLLCCDNCPSTFHTSCLQTKDIPEGNWYCPKCCCAICGCSQYHDKGLSADHSLVRFCIQCEHEYHVSCVRGGGIAGTHHWFCGDICNKVFTGLRSHVGLSHPLDGGFSWTLLRCRVDDQECQPSDAFVEQHSKLAVALAVMQECFVPMSDLRTNINMIPHVVYNRWSEFYRLNYQGFYTAILEKGDELISVASIRIHGARVAEMPLIGTREQYRRQGMCRRLVNAVEKMLSSLGVEHFTLPAIPQLLETWTCVFGFEALDRAQGLNLRDLMMMVFPGTQLLQKRLIKADPVHGDEMTVSDVNHAVGTCNLLQSSGCKELVPAVETDGLRIRNAPQGIEYGIISAFAGDKYCSEECKTAAFLLCEGEKSLSWNEDSALEHLEDSAFIDNADICAGEKEVAVLDYNPMPIYFGKEKKWTMRKVNAAVGHAGLLLTCDGWMVSTGNEKLKVQHILVAFGERWMSSMGIESMVFNVSFIPVDRDCWGMPHKENSCLSMCKGNGHQVPQQKGLRNVSESAIIWQAICNGNLVIVVSQSQRQEWFFSRLFSSIMRLMMEMSDAFYGRREQSVLRQLHGYILSLSDSKKQIDPTALGVRLKDLLD